MPGRMILSLLLVIPCSVTLAQDDAGQQQAAPSLNDMMSSAMQGTKPLPEHDRLRQLAGEWNYVVEMTMPGTPVMHGSGTTSIREIMGGRFIEMRSSSDGQPPVSSLMLMGYDSRKGKEEYFALGVDTLGHYYIDPRGTWNQSTASLELHGDEYDEASGQDMPYRQVYRFPGKDTMTLDVYIKMPGSKEDIRMVGVVYQRHQGRQVANPPTPPRANRPTSEAPRGSASASSASAKVPSYTGEQIEAMDRAELQSAIVEIMRARTMQAVQSASRAKLDSQYDMALSRLRSVRGRPESGATSNSGSNSGSGGAISSFSDGMISNMSMSQARAALTEIVVARRVPGLSEEQRSELSSAFQKVLARIASMSSPAEANADLKAVEKNASENEASVPSSADTPSVDTPSAEPTSENPS